MDSRSSALGLGKNALEAGELWFCGSGTTSQECCEPSLLTSSLRWTHAENTNLKSLVELLATLQFLTVVEALKCVMRFYVFPMACGQFLEN